MCRAARTHAGSHPATSPPHTKPLSPHRGPPPMRRPRGGRRTRLAARVGASSRPRHHSGPTLESVARGCAPYARFHQTPYRLGLARAGSPNRRGMSHRVPAARRGHRRHRQSRLLSHPQRTIVQRGLGPSPIPRSDAQRTRPAAQYVRTLRERSRSGELLAPPPQTCVHHRLAKARRPTRTPRPHRREKSCASRRARRQRATSQPVTPADRLSLRRARPRGLAGRRLSPP